ncbi:Endonuclease [Nymphaea thermarum]|nr:Endonuclease [Nymphaea thermarum]
MDTIPLSYCTSVRKPHLYTKFSFFAISSRISRFRIVSSAVRPQLNGQDEWMKALDWHMICNRLSEFTSTTIGLSMTQNGSVPFGRTREESQELLRQTMAAVQLPRPLDFSGIFDISRVVEASLSGKLCNIQELCTVRRTLESARSILGQLEAASSHGSSNRYNPLLKLFEGSDFCDKLESQIGFCLDCSVSVVLDRASEKLKDIRAERRKNMDELETLLKGIAEMVSRSKGVNVKPLITRRRSRMCVGVRATHRSLLPDGVILDVSSSGATYFMEPREAVELNNKEVRLLNAERSEEVAVLSMLTALVAESVAKLRGLMDRILQLDLASARGSYARWLDGVCPDLVDCRRNDEAQEEDEKRDEWSIDIDSIRHPLLVRSGLPSSSKSRHHPCRSDELEGAGDSSPMERDGLLGDEKEFPVPLDIKIRNGAKVVVISGPNTGGKTATMKTLGLASLMAKAGMFLPAKNQPKLPWFDYVLADIGDHQSLEHNLSTFSGHVSRLCKILATASRQSLVLIDEIGSGTDPSEGVALSVSILRHLAHKVNLTVVTTHCTDLSRLKNSDARFENAAMEFSLEILQPTYRILWGTTGDSNAISIARRIGFDKAVLNRAHEWIDKLMPNKNKEWKCLIYQSLLQERDKLQTQASKAATATSEIAQLYQEILGEAKDLDWREAALEALVSQQIQDETRRAKTQINDVLMGFEGKLSTHNCDLVNALIREAEIAISSIVAAHESTHEIASFSKSGGENSYIPKVGDRVHVRGLGDKLGTIVEAPCGDDTTLVQYGKVRLRVGKNDLKLFPMNKSISAVDRVTRWQGQAQRRLAKASLVEEKGNEGMAFFAPAVQTSKNTVDLRGMRVEEAAHHLDTSLSSCRPLEVLFVVHGMGTGVVKERALDILKNHPRVVKFEQESPMNYGCPL